MVLKVVAVRLERTAATIGHGLLAVALACSALFHATPAAAQSPEPRKAERVDELLAQGFEIKATIASPTGPRLILQKGSAIYNCDGYKLGTDVPPTTPRRGIGVDRTLCFAVKFR